MKKLLLLFAAALMMLSGCDTSKYKTFSVAGLQFDYPKDYKVEIDEADEAEGVWKVVVYNDDNDWNFARMIIFKYEPGELDEFDNDDIMNKLHENCMAICSNLIDSEEYEITDMSDLEDSTSGELNTWCFFTANCEDVEVTGMVTSSMLDEYMITSLCQGHEKEDGSNMVHVDSSVRKK